MISSDVNARAVRQATQHCPVRASAAVKLEEMTSKSLISFKYKIFRIPLAAIINLLFFMCRIHRVLAENRCLVMYTQVVALWRPIIRLSGLMQLMH